MKIKKKIALLLAMITLVSAIASCGDGTNDSRSQDDASSVQDDASSTQDGSADNGNEDSSATEQEEQNDFIAKELDGHLKNYVAASSKDGVAKDKNVIMIQLNSVSDVIMSASNGNVTPFLNLLKGEGIYFSNFYNQASDRVDVEYSALNSLLVPFGIEYENKNNIKYNSLASVLKKAGYKASAFTGADYNSARGESLLNAYGFDSVAAQGATDNDVYSKALEEMKKGSGKGFYFISNIDSLYPYINTEASNVSGAGFLSDYANAASKADSSLKTFIENLKKEGLYDNSLIVIYGSSPLLDYTYEEIEEKCGSFLAKGIDTASAHVVPMYILGVEKSEYKELSTVYDIYPTVLALTGADDKGVLVYGENVFSSSDRSEKFFPVQDVLSRGAYITDKISYVKYSKNSVICVDRVTGEKYKAADYKTNDTSSRQIANECEQVIRYNYFKALEKTDEETTLRKMYDDMPATGKLTALDESMSPLTAKTALMSYHTQFYYAYDYKGGFSGTNVYGRKLILDKGVKEGTYMSPAIKAGATDVLYTGWDIVYNGGAAEIYVSVSDANGSATDWLQIAKVSEYSLECVPFENDVVKVDSSRIYIKNGTSEGTVRIMIKLIASADGKSPELEYFTFTTSAVKVFDSNEADDLDIEKAEYKVSHVKATTAENSGSAGVACLVSSTTGKKPDVNAVAEKIFDKASNSYNNLSAICEYAHSLGVDAFIDYLDYEGVTRVLDKKQQILCYMDDTKSFSVIYGFEGKRKNITYYVYDILTGKDSKIAAADYAKKWDGFAVVMNTYIENIKPLTSINGQTSILPEGCQDRPGDVREKKYITIHNTGNYSDGATAASHAIYKINNNNNDAWTSWHFTVDSKEIYQHIPSDEVAWHASDGAEGPGNNNSIGIEICVNGFPEAENYTGAKYEAWEKEFTLCIENAAQLVAQLLIEYDLKIDCIRQHYDFARDQKNCPEQMRYSFATNTYVHEGDLWNEFMTMVEIRYNRLLATGDKFDTVNVG